MDRHDQLDSNGDTADAYKAAKLFALWAEGNPDKWHSLLGHTVLHHQHGRGVVSCVHIGERRVEVTFDTDESGKVTRPFQMTQFASRFALPELPQQLVDDEEGRRAAEEAYAQRRAERKRELDELRQRKEQADKAAAELAAQAETRAEFWQLKEEYGARSYSDSSPLSPLYRVLLLLRDGQRLAEDDVKYLEREGLFWTLAIHFARLYQKSQDPWDAARASGYWRGAKLPERAAELREPDRQSSPRARAAFYTSRAAAFADLVRVESAESDAQLANSLCPRDWKTLNVLGRIRYMMGDLDGSQAYFEEAERLGGSRDVVDRIKQRETRLLSTAQQAQAAGFLLSRDPLRYAWARGYLEQRGDR